jgi:5'-nucleotidase
MPMKKLILGGALALAAATTPAHAEFTLDILHINDFHSRFESITASDSNCNAEGEQKGECFGGVARLKTEIDLKRNEIQAAGGNSILLSAGDNFQGSLFYTTYKSKVVSDFMNQMGFDVVATGNHEFDDGPEEFRTFVLAANFPVVGGNFDVSKIPDLADKVKGTHIIEVGGEKIGIIGATTIDTPEIASPGPDVPFSPVIDWVKSAVADLESQQVNKIILLSHVGYLIDQQVAAEVSGVDLIVGGHSQEFSKVRFNFLRLGDPADASIRLRKPLADA